MSLPPECPMSIVASRLPYQGAVIYWLAFVALLAPSLAWADNEPLEAPPMVEPTKQYAPLGTEVMVPFMDSQLLEVFELSQTVEDPLTSTRPSEQEDPSGAVDASEPAPDVPSVSVTPPAPLPPPPATRLEVMLDWYPGPQHAALLLARGSEALERYGLELTLTTPADPNVPLTLLSAGRVDLALTRQPLLHLLVDRGQPLVRVATLVGTPLSGLLLSNENGLLSIAQMAGKRIGYADEDSRDILLAEMLEPHGISLEDITLRDVHFGLASALVEDKVDGVIGGMRLQLPRQVNDQGVATQLLKAEDFGVPSHEGLILVTNRDRLKSNHEAIRRLVDTLEELTAWIIEHPDAAWERLVEVEPALDTPTNRATWMPTLLRLSTRPAAVDHGRYAEFEAYLLDAGRITTLTPVERLAIDPRMP
ncbi:ABC transporter substrate-binding protein [Halomonas urumqiensis]|uniref:ABC transporter substrate-binding protein n=2 Tax=Halomonas urumqiensis TaxID=1684789 RepID=A0A2N7UEL5_9GAMM|nr:ABC transporter substrate-binding protein [Halomonas urumqiensis]PTB04217.1 ABC transporter substrate-binding protein [Halomonas urumqiensis]